MTPSFRAPSWPSSAPAAASAPAGGGSGNDSAPGAVPHAAQSSSRLDSSASRIAGRSNGTSPRCCATLHSRIATPGPSRPARPARWSAAARLMRSVVRRVRPVARSSRGERRKPPSITMRTPGTVSDVSAMLVASTTRRPGCCVRARSCSASGRSPCSGSTVAATPANARSVRRISPMPGRNAKMSPGWAASASRTARAMASGRSRTWARSRPCSTATG